MERINFTSGLPAPQGLYDPRFEHDACGIGFLANIAGQKSHDIITKGVQILIHPTHPGDWLLVAGELPGAPVIGELIPRGESTLLIR